MAFPKYKTRVTFLCCTQNLENVLDTCKVADICLFVTNGADGEEGAISPQADLLLTALRNQGLPDEHGSAVGPGVDLQPENACEHAQVLYAVGVSLTCEADCCRRS